MKRRLAIMADLPGPKIRIGQLAQNPWNWNLALNSP